MDNTKIPATATLSNANPAAKPKITYDDFKKVEISVGKVLSAEKIADADKLLKLSVDFAEPAGPRQIVSGIAGFFPDPAALAGKRCMFVTNLEPRTIRGYASDGMLFAVSTEAVPAVPPNADGTGGAPAIPARFSLLEPSAAADIPPGTKAK